MVEILPDEERHQHDESGRGVAAEHPELGPRAALEEPVGKEPRVEQVVRERSRRPHPVEALERQAFPQQPRDELGARRPARERLVGEEDDQRNPDVDEHALYREELGRDHDHERRHGEEREPEQEVRQRERTRDQGRGTRFQADDATARPERRLGARALRFQAPVIMALARKTTSTTVSRAPTAKEIVRQGCFSPR